MLFRDGVYVERPDGSLRFRWVKAPTSTGSGWLTQALARRIGRYLERQGLLERDAENSYLAGDETATARHTSSYFGHTARRSAATLATGLVIGATVRSAPANPLLRYIRVPEGRNAGMRVWGGSRVRPTAERQKQGGNAVEERAAYTACPLFC